MDGLGPVFVSHTSELANYPEGRSYVQAAVGGVLRAGFHPMEMGYFSAREEMLADYCVRVMRECDVYLGIIGFCYGSLVPDHPAGVSFTELEFMTATLVEIPRLVFLLDEGAPFPPRLVDTRRHAIDGFRARLKGAGILVKMVTSPDGLETAVLQALGELHSEWQRSRAREAAQKEHLQSRQVVACDPIRLGVHRAIEVANESHKVAQGSGLPAKKPNKSSGRPSQMAISKDGGF